jgi:hypothetical protein
MRGKGKTPPGRVNPTVKRFDLACVAQTKKDIAKDKKLSYRADQSPGGFGCGNSLLDFFRSQREQSKRWPLDRWRNRGAAATTEVSLLGCHHSLLKMLLL